jgi:hypothetical protein
MKENLKPCTYKQSEDELMRCSVCLVTGRRGRLASDGVPFEE